MADWEQYFEWYNTEFARFHNFFDNTQQLKWLTTSPEAELQMARKAARGQQYARRMVPQKLWQWQQFWNETGLVPMPLPAGMSGTAALAHAKRHRLRHLEQVYPI